ERTGISSVGLRCGFEGVQQLLRDTLQGAANECAGQVREWDPLIAVSCQLGIEWDGPEAGDLQARWPALSRVEACGGDEEVLDGVAIAAVVAAHVLDVTEHTIGCLRQSGR